MIKVGSIVAIKPIDLLSVSQYPLDWVPACDGKTPYMVRGIDKAINEDSTLATFEEGVIAYDHESQAEFGLPIELLIEILPPGEIEEEIKEVVNQGLLITV